MMRLLSVCALFLLFTPASAQNQRKLLIGADTTILYGIGTSGNQLTILNGTENRTRSFLMNKGGGQTEFSYAVDSIWYASDTLYVQRANLNKFQIGARLDTVVNGITINNGIIKLGGDLTKNTVTSLNEYDYVLEKDSFNYTRFNALRFTSRRSNEGHKTLLEQGNSIQASVRYQDSSSSQLLLNDTLSSISYAKRGVGHSGIVLSEQSIIHNSKRHIFSGDWVKMPAKSQTEIGASPSVPAAALLYNSTTNSLNVSNGETVNPVALEYLDGSEITTTTPTYWANGNKIPLLRIRHPNNVSGIDHGDVSMDRDFKIIPYQYGMAIEYNGVLENWVGEFSIHRGLAFYDLEGQNNGWGAVLWVGDDHDYGGLRMTARNNTMVGGNVKYTEIASTEFSGASAGNMRLRTIDSSDRVDFVIGGKASPNVYSHISPNGIKFPEVSSAFAVNTPSKGLTVFDAADNSLKYYNGSAWIKTSTEAGGATIKNDIILSVSSSKIQYVDASNGAVNISLPVGNPNLNFKIVRLDNSSNLVTVTAPTDNTVNGVVFKTIESQYECMNLYSNELNRWIATQEKPY